MAETVNTAGHNRAEVIREAFATAINDNSVLHIYGQTSDLFYNGGRLQRLLNVLAAEAAEHDMPTIVYSLGDWARSLVAREGLVISPLPHLDLNEPPTLHVEKLFARMSKAEQPCCLVLDYAEALIPCAGQSGSQAARSRLVEQILAKSTDITWQRQGHVIVLISRVETTDQGFRRMPGVLNCDVRLPEEEERRDCIERMQANERQPLLLEASLSSERLARIAGGLNIDEISRWRYRSSSDNPLTADQIINHKSNSVREKAGSTLSVADERLNMNSDIAGLENVKQYVRDCMKLGARKVSVLLAGGPGTGKSTVATAIGAELGAVVLFLDQPKSKWVGETEDNIKRALDIAESMAPSVLVIDEADQTVFGKRRQNSGDESSSVDSSARAILMQWMGDTAKDNGVSVVAMTNNPAGIDAAILDRMETLAVLEQTSPAGKANVLRLQGKRVGVDVSMAAAEAAFRQSDKVFTGRQITRLLGASRLAALNRDSKQIENQDILAAIATSLHHFGRDEMLASMRAVLYTSTKDYLPWVAAWRAGDLEATPPPYLSEFVDNNGMVDVQALQLAIRELEGSRVV
jgi:AAA+ superfamily predicted ATPase